MFSLCFPYAQDTSAASFSRAWVRSLPIGGQEGRPCQTLPNSLGCPAVAPEGALVLPACSTSRTSACFSPQPATFWSALRGWRKMSSAPLGKRLSCASSSTSRIHPSSSLLTTGKVACAPSSFGGGGELMQLPSTNVDPWAHSTWQQQLSKSFFLVLLPAILLKIELWLFKKNKTIGIFQ